MSLAELRGDVVILACAVSAGIHGALAPEHFEESFGAGLGFVAAAVLLAVVVAWLTRQPASSVALAGAVAVFAGLLVSYALAVTTGLPVLHPDPEPVEGLALATKAIEAVGVLAAWSLLRRPDEDATEGNAGRSTTLATRPIPIALTALVASFSVLAALAVSNGHTHSPDDAHHHSSAPVRLAQPPSTLTAQAAT